MPLELLGARIWCYGSRARGDYHPFSDLDIMIEAENNISPEKIGNIREVLENSNFPYKVDLVMLSEFANSYIPKYQQEKKRFH